MFPYKFPVLFFRSVAINLRDAENSKQPNSNEPFPSYPCVGTLVHGLILQVLVQLLLKNTIIIKTLLVSIKYIATVSIEHVSVIRFKTCILGKNVSFCLIKPESERFGLFAGGYHLSDKR